MFRKQTREEAPTLWLATSDLVSSPANSFYQLLDRCLSAAAVGDQIRALARPYYEMDASKGGQPGIDPEVYVKMTLVGFFENLPSNRAIAARCADSLAIRAFLHYELTTTTPVHSSLSVIRQRLPLEVHDGIFDVVLRAMQAAKLVKGKRLAIDTSVMEAQASLRTLHHRVTGEQYRKYVKRLAKEAGVDVTDPRAVSTFDRKRPGRTTSNTEWANPHDPDAKVGPDKKGVTRMIYKPEHVVDLETGAIVHVELKPGDERDARGLADRIYEAAGRVSTAKAPEAALEQMPTDLLVADMGYYDLPELEALQATGIRTAVPDPVARRRVGALPAAAQQVVRRAARTLRSATGTALMRQRGERAERTFVHVLDYGGARRTTLRGRDNILKQYLLRVCGFNLALLLRRVAGIGTLKQMCAASERAVSRATAAVLRPAPVAPT